MVSCFTRQKPLSRRRDVRAAWVGNDLTITYNANSNLVGTAFKSDGNDHGRVHAYVYRNTVNNLAEMRLCVVALPNFITSRSAIRHVQGFFGKRVKWFFCHQKQNSGGAWGVAQHHAGAHNTRHAPPRTTTQHTRATEDLVNCLPSLPLQLRECPMMMMMLRVAVVALALVSYASAQTAGLTQCSTTYATASQSAGGSLSALCTAATAYETCLNGLSSDTIGLASAKSAAASAKSTVCGAPSVPSTGGLAALTQCSTTYASASQAAAGSMSGMCTAVTAYETCLNSVPAGTAGLDTAKSAAASAKSSVCQGGSVTKRPTAPTTAFPQCDSKFVPTIEDSGDSRLMRCKAGAQWLSCAQEVITSLTGSLASSGRAEISRGQLEFSQYCTFRVRVMTRFPNLSVQQFSGAVLDTAKQAVATKLGVAVSQIKTISIKSGSVVWDYEVENLSPTAAESVQSTVASPTYSSAFTGSQLSGASSSSSIQAPPSQGSGFPSGSTSSGMIAGAVIGGIVIVGLVVGIAFATAGKSGGSKYGRFGDDNVADDVYAAPEDQYASSYTTLDQTEEA
eukprot:m.404684 g.404684  ORF g.404684 m.404684 type:complete len:565 (+) comp20127_c0_seq1:1144-2838(+)